MKNALLSLYLKGQSAFYVAATGLGKDKVTVNQVDAADTVGKFFGLIFQVLTWGGAGMIIWGGWEFWQTLDDGGGDKRNKAFMKIIGGIGAISLRFILQNMGVVS